MDQPGILPTEGPDPHTLPRVLGPFDAITVVIGSIIGSGIFFKEPTIVRDLPSFGLSVAVWIFLGIITLSGSLALAELSAMLPHAGGAYVYLREAYGKLPGFLYGWAEFWVIRTGSLGALACATVLSLNEIVPLSHTWQMWLAIAIILGLSLINIVGTRWGANVQNLTVVIKVAFLAAIIVLPWLLAKVEVSNLSPVWPDRIDGGLWRGLGLAMLAVFWPYDGWINIAPVAEEICEPQRNIPLSLTVGVSLVIVVYVGASISYHLLLPMKAIAESKVIAADACRVLFGPVGGTIAALGIMCSTFGAVNSNLLTGPRIYFAAARDGLIPKSLAAVHANFRTPVNAILLQAIWTVLLILLVFAWKSGPKVSPLDKFDALTDYAIIGGLAFYAMTVAAVPLLRRRLPDLPRPYRCWGYPITPLVYPVVVAAVVIDLIKNRPVQVVAVAALLVAGTAYFAWASRRSTSES